MPITMLGAPPEWKRHQKRVTCPACKSSFWTIDGALPRDHDKPNGRRCLPNPAPAPASTLRAKES